MSLESFEDFALRTLRELQAYGTAVAAQPELTGLGNDHSGDIAARLAALNPSLVLDGVRDPALIAAELRRLRETDPAIFEPAPLGQHLFRLMRAARNAGFGPGGANASLAAGVDRMMVSDKRRVAYAIKKRFAAAGLEAPSPQASDGNIAQSRELAPGIEHHTAYLARRRDGALGGRGMIGGNPKPQESE